MNKTPHVDNYLELLEKLKAMAETIQRKAINSDSPDVFFSNNSNFFTKSFMVTMCAYLESYLKDVLMIIVDEMNRRFIVSKIPYNLVRWCLAPDKDKKDLLKEKDLRFENFSLSIKRKDLDDFISGNPYKTKNLFQQFGIDIENNTVFKSQLERINTIIGKRNSIIHHNDDALDITLRDVIEHIDFFIAYINNIDYLVVTCIYSTEEAV